LVGQQPQALRVLLVLDDERGLVRLDAFGARGGLVALSLQRSKLRLNLGSLALLDLDGVKRAVELDLRPLERVLGLLKSGSEVVV
jgi:hypothetical protein